MATAKTSTVLIPQAPIIPPPIEKKRVILELSINEAETLALILGRVGGAPGTGSRRGHCDAIDRALRDAGINRQATLRAINVALDYREFSKAVLDGGLTFSNENLNPSKD